VTHATKLTGFFERCSQLNLETGELASGYLVRGTLDGEGFDLFVADNDLQIPDDAPPAEIAAALRAEVLAR
jgi:hypothetical protein